MAKLENDIARLIRKYQSKTGKFLTIATVESATGGRAADRITNVAGSSDYFQGSVVSYSNDIKENVVGVKEEVLLLFGAVSPETAEEMALGGRKTMKVDICVSTTGIAGPGGATPQKPVGLFYLGLSANDTLVSHKHIFSGSREEIKQKATEKVLHLLKEHLQRCLDSLDNKPPDEKHVVTCFLEHNDMILILRRSGRVGTYKRAWAGVSGYIEANDIDQAYTEIREETGLFKNNIRLLRQGKPLEVFDKALNRNWVVHPFLFHVSDPDKIKTDWEHTESKWIKPKDLAKYNTVPGLAKALQSVI
ncbi:MAG: nicotinamide-nucleotide amidohydrolase family protein [Dehalococcoidia bacterium]|nr:nicotinamide-nucleotide amidohydrolase family protein [Dehalococcoidia bacterium]